MNEENFIRNKVPRWLTYCILLIRILVLESYRLLSQGKPHLRLLANYLSKRWAIVAALRTNLRPGSGNQLILTSRTRLRELIQSVCLLDLRLLKVFMTDMYFKTSIYEFYEVILLRNNYKTHQMDFFILIFNFH